MNIPLIYVAGPFRSATPLGVRRHVEAARDVGLKIAECGAFPIIPHTMTADFDKLLTDDFWLAGHVALLLRCDAMFLMASWVKSAGAREEYNMATLSGIRVFREEIDGFGELAWRVRAGSVRAETGLARPDRLGAGQ